MKGFAEWLDNILKESLPENIVAVNFNLYDDGDNQWSMEFIGTSTFDVDDPDWACDEVFTTRDKPFSFESEMSWEHILNESVNIIKIYLEKGIYGDKLKEYEGIGVGFVDGDIVIVHEK